MSAVSPQPRISVVVPTRNRPTHAAECVASILKSDGFIELLVVDQSDDRKTEAALRAMPDPRLRYVRAETRGSANARNDGLRESRGDVIAFTDDDCRVAIDWIASLSRIFADDPDAAIVCGRVHVPAEISAQGYAVAFEPQVREWRGRCPRPGQDWGITANFALRRTVLQRIGEFDPVLGTGAALLSGGEPDFIYRALRTGMKVINAREVQVEHLGARAPGTETHKLWRSYARGTGAAIFKHVRLGDPNAIWLYIRFLAECVRVIVRNLVRGERPTLIGFTLMFLSGSIASLRFRIDRDLKLYVPRS